MHTTPPKRFRTRAGRRGSNVVEFALTLPVFLYLMLGVLDYGYLMMAQSILDAAAMEGTREGAITDPNLVANIATVAEARAAAMVGGICGADCTYTCTDQGNPPTREITCDLRWNIHPLAGFVPYPTQIQSQGRQLLEWQRAR